MPRMGKYGESKMTQIMMATVPHITSGSGLRKFQADGFLFDRMYSVASGNYQLYRSVTHLYPLCTGSYHVKYVAC